jgi:hypothetical protein
MGVVEPPTPPTEVAGVIYVLYAVIWFFGAVITLRISMLMMMDMYQRRRIAKDDASFTIFAMTLFWPIALLGIIGWKLAFPRGIKTQYDKERELQAALKKADQEAKEQEQRIRSLEKQVLAWVPGPYDRDGRS